MAMNDRAQPKPSPSELRASERGLVEQHVFETAVHRTRMVMALSDPNLPDSPLVYVNPSFTELTGYSFEEAVGRNCRFLQGPDTDRDTVRRIREGLAAHRTIDEELYNYRKDGSGFWNALYVSPVFDDGGRLIYHFASQVDVTERREAQRRQAQRLESMGALASGVAHEFNNLMTVVLGSVERAVARGGDENQRRHLAHADWAAKRAGQLAGELLGLARRQNRKHRLLDLNHAVRGFAGALEQAVPANVAVRLDLQPTPMAVRLDGGQLELVVTNLVRNAAEAMLEGGQVSVSVRTASVLDPASALAGAGAVELVVADTGTGMPPEVAERATELFFTTKPPGKGTGLGLFLALEFMDRSAGKLLIESEVGRGTTVRMVFPQASGDGPMPA